MCSLKICLADLNTTSLSSRVFKWFNSKSLIWEATAPRYLMLIPWEWNAASKLSESVGTPSTFYRSLTSFGIACSFKNFAISSTKSSSYLISSSGWANLTFLNTFVLYVNFGASFKYLSNSLSFLRFSWSLLFWYSSFSYSVISSAFFYSSFDFSSSSCLLNSAILVWAYSILLVLWYINSNSGLSRHVW